MKPSTFWFVFAALIIPTLGFACSNQQAEADGGAVVGEGE